MKVIPQVSMEFTAQLVINEAELRVLNHLAGYGENLVKSLTAHVTKDFDAAVLSEMLSRLHIECSAIIKKIDDTRMTFQGKGKKIE